MEGGGGQGEDQGEAAEQGDDLSNMRRPSCVPFLFHGRLLSVVLDA